MVSFRAAFNKLTAKEKAYFVIKTNVVGVVELISIITGAKEAKMVASGLLKLKGVKGAANLAKKVKDRVVKGIKIIFKKEGAKPISPPTVHGKLRKAMLARDKTPPFEGAQAHHGLPWNHRKWFAKKGIDVNEVKYGAWVKGGGNGNHQSWSRAYDKAWKEWMDGHQNATKKQIEAYYNKLRKDKRWGGGF